MSQPFRSSGASNYDSTVWSGARLQMLGDRIVISLQEPVYALSSAIHPGGFSQADHIVNWKVPLDYRCDDPIRDFIRRCDGWGSKPELTIGMLTAAKLTHASVKELEGDRFKLLCISTSGTRNAARAGLPRQTFSAYEPGTINTVLLIDGQMTESAMVNAVITATEAKAAALHELGIVETANGRLATGTTTDAIVIGVSQRASWQAMHAYAGVATTIGCAIGEAVYETVLEATRTQHEK